MPLMNAIHQEETFLEETLLSACSPRLKNIISCFA
jgi:hypothetical protein